MQVGEELHHGSHYHICVMPSHWVGDTGATTFVRSAVGWARASEGSSCRLSASASASTSAASASVEDSAVHRRRGSGGKTVSRNVHEISRWSWLRSLNPLLVLLHCLNYLHHHKHLPLFSSRKHRLLLLSRAAHLAFFGVALLMDDVPDISGRYMILLITIWCVYLVLNVEYLVCNAM